MGLEGLKQTGSSRINLAMNVSCLLMAGSFCPLPGIVDLTSAIRGFEVVSVDGGIGLFV